MPYSISVFNPQTKETADRTRVYADGLPALMMDHPILGVFLYVGLTVLAELKTSHHMKRVARIR